MARRTIARDATCEGIALHAGQLVRLTLLPAPAGAGVVFRRSDLDGREIPARYDRVTETRLGTVIDDGEGVRVGVIEHLMAAIAGAEIDDIVAVLDGPEPPILDGDAQSYLALIDAAGLAESQAPRPHVQVLKKVTAESGDAYALIEPHASRVFDVDIAFASAAIGTQSFRWEFSQDGFRREIAPARTFGFFSELETLHKMGFAKGASLDNTLALDGDRVVNQDKQRFADEFVRHKILDALGDLALAGAPILGRFEGHRSGHALNNALLRALFSDPSNYAWRE